ncbi:MAG TPA: protein-L-isoaspartate(D-aspartate) O-methyltransferase [Burkholderiales bacterium]|nr:protein-L-isoaspartate(D-aspartate) O-methyltransferase [Burkholderiales bacterium]
MSERLSGIGMTSQRTRLRMIERLREQGVTDEAVLNAMYEIPRHIFVEEALAHRAYEDIPLPIGFGQTISQPYIVARMTEMLTAGKRLGKVLEIGTGCGYQTAILARLAEEVYTVERLLPLLTKARRNLRELRISNVRTRHADGHAGIPEAAPFDGIMVAAAASHLPEALKQQLAVGGRMVIPIGIQQQTLYLIERDADGFSQSELDAVRFVPMLSGVSQ